MTVFPSAPKHLYRSFTKRLSRRWNARWNWLSIGHERRLVRPSRRDLDADGPDLDHPDPGLGYPQFHRVGAPEFARYHFAHCFRIGLVVVPLLFVEAVTAGWLLWQGQRGLAFLISVGLIPVVWISTAFFQAPLHTKLMRGFAPATVRRLIVTNWVRTLAWTARGVLVSCAFVS